MAEHGTGRTPRVKRPVYCWDTSVMLDWLEPARNPDRQTPAFAAVVREIDDKAASLLMPAVIYTEVLEARQRPVVMAQFYQFLLRTNVMQVNVTVDLAREAGRIRSACLGERPPRSIRSLDSLFLAAAVQYSVDMLHTFDDGMLNLSGSTHVNGLTICHPRRKDGGQAIV